jgi:hypothetical protein
MKNRQERWPLRGSVLRERERVSGVRALVTGYQGYLVLSGVHDFEVRHILSHSSGFSGWDIPFVTEDVYDWDKATARRASQAPR